MKVRRSKLQNKERKKLNEEVLSDEEADEDDFDDFYWYCFYFLFVYFALFGTESLSVSAMSLNFIQFHPSSLKYWLKILFRTGIGTLYQHVEKYVDKQCFFIGLGYFIISFSLPFLNKCILERNDLSFYTY